MTTLAKQAGRIIYEEFYDAVDKINSMGVKGICMLEITTTNGTEYALEVNGEKILLTPGSTIEMYTGNLMGFEIIRVNFGVTTIIKYEIDVQEKNIKEIIIH